MPASIIPVVLAGGAGARLWPMSRDALPKQFLPIIGSRSSYQETLLRVADPIFAPPLVITGPNLHFFARRQAEDVGIEVTVIVEPMRRDSAPAIAAAAVVAQQRDPDALVLAVAADHVIPDAEAFRDACRRGASAANNGFIVCFGVKATQPKTSYGYILPGEVIANGSVHSIKRFVEKPDTRTAANYVRDGYLWNSGNFLFRPKIILSELARLEPTLLQAVQAAVNGITEDLGFLRLDANAFASAPQKSIDYALMEKTDCAAVVIGDFRWSDIGSWDALFDIATRDSNDNVVQGPVVTIDTKNCVINASDRLIGVIGGQDLVIVSTSDAVMVVPRERAQEVRDLVIKLKSEQRPEAIVHRRVHRPWGYYESIDAGERFKVKRIVVSPGGKLSLQKHKHRAEHWVVVRGTAEVTLGDVSRAVHENESIFIPIGSVHRLANQGRIPLELIEVQTGSYLGEDDIVRLDDVYHRDLAEK